MSSEQDKVLQPSRVIVGHCPNCGEVIVVVNDYEVWPYVVCRTCDWKGATTSIANRDRYERGGRRGER